MGAQYWAVPGTGALLCERSSEPRPGRQRGTAFSPGEARPRARTAVKTRLRLLRKSLAGKFVK